MSRWQCSKCFRVYSSEELLRLPHEKAVDEDTDPKSQHGFVSVCRCGNAFHKNKWCLLDKINTSDGQLRVSTVHLELDHSFGENAEPIWYETMIFHGDSFSDLYAERYHTMEEAQKRHNQLVQFLKESKYKIEKEQVFRGLKFDE